MYVVLCMMMEDSVKPSIQMTMVGGTVNLVGRSVHKNCCSCINNVNYHYKFPCLILVSCIHINALIFLLQLVHCGCIVSFNTHLLLDFGGIICMECSRLNFLLVGEN